ncbi:hypothetical protein [Ottowia sp.]|jgi:hypothetical protein|uniref:hypothetical protein n=1 Tax=Ottowia sp. TaxID=1898956 RepID=UPI00262C968D|nr:hypothetical protein [Ottowia sp.]
MPRQIITIGPVPCEENAAQVGRSDYDKRSRLECQVFKRMLERLHPIPASCPATLVIHSFPHEFGAYREVCVRYDDTDQDATNYAFDLEGDTPAEWDAIARYELIWFERLEALTRAVRKGAMRPDEVPALFQSGQLPALPAGHTFSQLLAAFPL